LMAREIAGATPFRFHIDGLSCIAGSLAGDLDRAIWCAEASHAQAPLFVAPLRYLSVLYLIQDQREKSVGIVKKLRQLEPDFSYDLLREASYPAAGLRQAKLLDRLPRSAIAI
jgi:hypothetical protein